MNGSESLLVPLLLCIPVLIGALVVATIRLLRAPTVPQGLAGWSGCLVLACSVCALAARWMFEEAENASRLDIDSGGGAAIISIRSLPP